jgi:hypothetical protein
MEICHRCQELKKPFETISFGSFKFGQKVTYKYHICKECVEEMHQEMFDRATTQKESPKEEIS